MNKRRWKILTLVIVVVVLVVTAKYFGIQEGIRRMLRYIHDLGPWAPLAYIGFYAIACIFAIPGSLLTLAGGFASTVSWPATQFLIQKVGWSGAYFAYVTRK